MPEAPIPGVQRPAGTGPTEDSVQILEEHPPEDPALPSHDVEPAAAGVTLANLFRHPLAHPIVLDLCLLKKYGVEWLGWEWETVQLRVLQDFRSGLSTLNLSKLMAMATLHLVDTYWQRWEVFCWLTMPFNGLIADFETMQKPSVIECLISVDIASRVRNDVQWDPEVVAYLSTVFRYDGLLVPISPCDFVPVETHDIGFDAEAVKKEWPRVRDSRRAPQDESVASEQLRRMLVAYDALEENRALLRHQLPLVEHV